MKKLSLEERIARAICETWGYEWCKKCKVSNRYEPKTCVKCPADDDDQVIHSYHNKRLDERPDKLLFTDAARAVLDVIKEQKLTND